MRNVLILCCWLVACSTAAQSVASLNLNYLYNPTEEVQAHLRPQKENGRMRVDYRFEFKPIDNQPQAYSLKWERRDSYTQRTGSLIRLDSFNVDVERKPVINHLTVEISEKPWLLVGIVQNKRNGKQWTFFQQIENNYPVMGRLENESGTVFPSYVLQGQTYTVQGSGAVRPVFVSYYRQNDFTPAFPPFADKLPPVERFIFHDSSFRVNSGSPITFKKLGLYLFQEDTTASEGFAIQVMTGNFPKYSKIEQLREPLLFISTPEEFKNLEAAGSEKAKFDKVILDITKDKDRARNFMRSYFRRVELANEYFTSYKEGWRSDRGMVFLIFGPPDELLFNSGNQVWRYKAQDITFTFVKSGSVYDPDHFILLRDKRFVEPWFATVDLWRKARF